jgi:hypothetical protein
MNTPGGNPYLKNWPFTRTSIHLFPVVAEGIDSAQGAADFDGDGNTDIVVQANIAPPLVVPGDPGPQSQYEDPPNQLPLRTDGSGNTVRGFEPSSIFGQYNHADIKSDTMVPVFSQPSIGDLDVRSRMFPSISTLFSRWNRG